MTIALSFCIEGKIEKLMDECITSVQNGITCAISPDRPLTKQTNQWQAGDT